MSRTDNTWEQIESMVREFAEEAGRGEEETGRLVDSIQLLKRSAWNNPLHLQAKNGGLHFFNLFWDRSPIGAITSAKGDPLQFYVVADSYDELIGQVSEEAQTYLEDAGERHYGEGSVRIRLRKMLHADDARSLLNECHEAVTRDDSSGNSSDDSDQNA